MLIWPIPSIGNYKEVSELPNFQQSVNQTLGIAGAFAGLSGVPQRAAEKRNIKKQQAVLDKQVEAATAGGKPIKPEIEAELNQKQLELSKRKFETNPSEKTYQEYVNQIPTTVKEDPEMLHEERMESIPDIARRNAEYSYAYQQAYRREMSNLEMQEQAMARQNRQKQAKKTQKRNFMDYLAKQPTTLGGTIGDLSPDLQKKIASQYDRNARRRMMNQMDREARDGKQQ